MYVHVPGIMDSLYGTIGTLSQQPQNDYGNRIPSLTPQVQRGDTGALSVDKASEVCGVDLHHSPRQHVGLHALPVRTRVCPYHGTY